MGKWYSVPNFVRYKNDLEVDRNLEMQPILPHVISLARSFPKDAVAIGSLTLNDLIQAGNLGLCEAWNRVDWDRINSSPNPQGELWSFLKIRIKGAIRREIDKHAEHVARPINMMENARKNMDFTGVDKVLVSIFPKIYDDGMAIFQHSPWRSVELENIINEYLDSVEKSNRNRDILLMYYGIGYPHMSQKELADKFSITEANIQQIVKRTRNKLKTNEFEKLIDNYYENN